MSISFESEDIILKKLRERLRRMTDEELIRFGKDVRKLAENPFQKQLEEAKIALNGGASGWSDQRLEKWRFALSDLVSETAGGAGRKPSLCHASRQ